MAETGTTADEEPAGHAASGPTFGRPVFDRLAVLPAGEGEARSRAVGR